MKPYLPWAAPLCLGGIALFGLLLWNNRSISEGDPSPPPEESTVVQPGGQIPLEKRPFPRQNGAIPHEQARDTHNAAERITELLCKKSYAPALVSWRAYENLWKQWGLSEKPNDFAAAVRERYGLHEAPYPNKGLPMGLREAPWVFGNGVGFDCLLCHASSFDGKPIIGLGNASIEWQALFDELFASQGLPHGMPHPFSYVRGTTEAAVQIGYQMQFRDADLNRRPKVAIDFNGPICEDAPAWWLLKKKKHLYHPGSHPGESVRVGMAFLLHPLNDKKVIKESEKDFADLRALLLSLEPPKYPFPIDARRAATGRRLFEQHCARCHGTYGPDGSYPSKIIDLKTLGTDPKLSHEFRVYAQDAYNSSWFGKETDGAGRPLEAKPTDGYQAPPLDGVWATAPYLHNGSVPTVYGMLHSPSRPAIWTRSYRTGAVDYDPFELGWKVQVLEQAPDPAAPAIERRKVHDASQVGRRNSGHTFGDRLTHEERMAVLEYLKTL
jgi:Cytochrome c